MAERTDEASDQVHGDVRSRTNRKKQSKDQSKECEPCKVDNIKLPASGWCETCDEMLCNVCYRIHCRLKMMKHHQLWSITEMSSRKKMKKVESKCQTHEGKRLKYYCEDHEELFCNQCFVSKHRQCRKVVCIADVTTSESSEFKTMQLLLSKLEKRLNIMGEKMEKNVSITGRQHDKAVESIQEAGEKLKALIDTLVKEQIAKAEMTKNDNTRNIDKFNRIKTEVQEELTAARDMIAAVKGDNNQLFITMKQLKGESKVLESKLSDSELNNITEYKFVLNPDLARLLDKVTEFGTLKPTRELKMDKATDEVVNELEVRRFQHSTNIFLNCLTYNGILSDSIQMSTDRDICLLYVLLYPCNSGDTRVKLNIKEDGKILISCASTHTRTDSDVIAVKVIGDRDVHGMTLQAGHRYDVVAIITGDQSFRGFKGLAEVTESGVKFSFSNTNLFVSRNTVSEGQIPGFRFSLK